MFSAAELIDAVHARFRRRFPLQPDRAFGQFPPTWRAWFLAIPEHSGAVTGVPASDYVEVLSRRPARVPDRAVAAVSRWRAVPYMARQQWEPAPRDERGLRRFAAATSGVLHLVFVVALLWVGYVTIADAPPEADQAGEALLIEYIGTGAPQDTGGAPPPGDAPSAPSAAAGAPSPSPSPATPADSEPAEAIPVTPPVGRQAPVASQTPVPTPPAEAASAQTLTVTETTQPDSDFMLPPPVLRDPALPQQQLRVATPRLATEVGEVQTLQPQPSIRTLAPPTPRLPTPDVPRLRTEVTEIQVRQPLPQLRPRDTPLPVPRPQNVRVPDLQTRPGDIQVRARPAPPTPATAAATPAQAPAVPAAAPGQRAAAGRGPATTPSPAAGGRPQSQGGAVPGTPSRSGAGPAASAPPGAAPGTVRSDDWGNANRNAPGNSASGTRSPGRGSGLLNEDGTARLPGDSTRVGGGLPPGTILEDFDKIDRMGTWLKRPPLDYTPTRFDKFWVPDRSLLEEWVSRGIKKVAVPIPGTSKRIECTVSLLQLGGGCTVSDPNLQDQEATARPPPEVPFKPDLVEDQGALARPPGG